MRHFNFYESDVIAFYGVMKDSYIYFFILKIIFHVYLPGNAKQKHFLSFVNFKSELKWFLNWVALLIKLKSEGFRVKLSCERFTCVISHLIRPREEEAV